MCIETHVLVNEKPACQQKKKIIFPNKQLLNCHFHVKSELSRSYSTNMELFFIIKNNNKKLLPK